MAIDLAGVRFLRWSSVKENVVADCFSLIKLVVFAPPTVDVAYIEKAQSFDQECKLLIEAVERQQLRLQALKG